MTKKRAKNGTVPRTFDPRFKSSYQKLKEENGRLRDTGRTALLGLAQDTAAWRELRAALIDAGEMGL